MTLKNLLSNGKLFPCVLKELSLKEQLLEKMEKDLDLFKRKFSVILHQKVMMDFFGLLYFTLYCERSPYGPRIVICFFLGQCIGFLSRSTHQFCFVSPVD